MRSLLKLVFEQAVQDPFLNTLRRDRAPVTIYLQSGVKLAGVVRSFDKFCVLLESGGHNSLIFKQGISTIIRLPVQRAPSNIDK